MPRNARLIITDESYHVTQRGNNRQDVFYSPKDREVYLDLVQANLADAGVRVHAYCLMTNHVHWVVQPQRADSLAVLFRRVHGRYAQYCNAARRASGHLWQNRFFSCLLSPRHLDLALRYVERNPVRASIVRRPEDYPYSSAAAHLSATPESNPLLDLRIWRQLGGAPAWSKLLDTHDPDALLNLLRRCTYAERPFGDEQFITQIESQSGRNWCRYPYQAELQSAGLILSLNALRSKLDEPALKTSTANKRLPHE